MGQDSSLAYMSVESADGKADAVDEGSSGPSVADPTLTPRRALKRWEAVQFTVDRNSDGPMRVPTSPLMGGEPLITAAGALFTPPFFRPGPITINKNGILATFNEKSPLPCVLSAD